MLKLFSYALCSKKHRIKGMSSLRSPMQDVNLGARPWLAKSYPATPDGGGAVPQPSYTDIIAQVYRHAPWLPEPKTHMSRTDSRQPLIAGEYAPRVVSSATDT